jgi:hypothetical protein
MDEQDVANKDVKVIGKAFNFDGSTRPPKFKGYMLSENNDTLAGPFVDQAVSAVTNAPNEGFLVVTEENKVLTTDLTQFKDTVFPKPPADVWWNSKYPLRAEEYGFVASPTEDSFHYRGLYLETPFAEPTDKAGVIKDPKYYRDGYLAIAETNWIHLGDEHNEKQVHRIDLSFHKNSFGNLWCYIANEEKKYSGQFKGPIQEHMKVFTNLRGRRFKIKLLIGTHKEYPWALREISIGHLMGKSF